MGEDSPGYVLKAIPLFEEVIAAMITDAFDVVAVGNADLAQVRRVNYQFASIRQHGLKLVHAFAGGPKLVIHWRRAREDGMEGFFLRGNMDLSRKVAGFIPSIFGRAGEQAGEIFIGINDHAET